MSSMFRVALVGAGMITRESHLPAVLASPNAELTAIVDPVAERAAELGKAYGMSPRIASRVEDVLGEIDGAVIATPNDSHRPIAVACLVAGVSVLIEKPLASTYEDGSAIVRAAEAAGKIVAVGYSSRFRDNVLLLKSLLDEDYFGTVRRFAHQFGTAGGWAPFSAYNLDRKTAGGGVLVVTGTHFLDRMLYLWGHPDEVFLEDDSLDGPEANCTATFRYTRRPAPIEGVARYSKTAQLPAGLVIETDRGHLILDDTDSAEIVFRPDGRSGLEQIVRRSRSARAPERDVFELQLEDFIAACQEQRRPLVDGRQGLASLRLLEQLYASRKTTDPAWYESQGTQVPT